MPYIKQEDRVKIKAGAFPDNAGELNYFISTTVLEYIRKKGLCYQKLNEAIGVLECVKLEMYRQKVAAYEDVKSKENGDIFDTSYTETIGSHTSEGFDGHSE